MDRKIIGAMNFIVLYMAIDFVDRIYSFTMPNYIEISFKEKIQKFNQANNFSFYKVNLLPFFMSTAYSVIKNEMIDFFTSFKKNNNSLDFYFSPSSIGIINTGLRELIQNKDKRFLFTVNENMTDVSLDSLPMLISTEELEEYILSEYFVGDEKSGEDLFWGIKYNLDAIYIRDFTTKNFSSLLYYMRSITSLKVFFEKDLERTNPNFSRNISSFNSVIKAEPYFWENILLT